MSGKQRAAAGNELTGWLHEVVQDARRVAAYIAIGTEPPTAALVALRGDILLPVLLADGDLDWAVGAETATTSRGLVEPTGPRLGPEAIATCAVVLVPAFAVDGSGNRLGRGGGSYDRALRRATGLTVALLYDGELVEELPAEPHDIAVAAVATPSGGVMRLPLRQ